MLRILLAIVRDARPGAATALAKVTGVIVTARVRLRAAAGCEAPPVRPAQRKFFRCLGVKRGQFHEKNRHVIPQTQPTETGYYYLMLLSSVYMPQGGSPQRSKGLKRKGPALIERV